MLLLAAGVLLGPSVSGAIDVPARLDRSAASCSSLGVSFILFHGGLQLSTRVLEPGRGRARRSSQCPGSCSRRSLPGSVPRRSRSASPLTSGLLIGAVLAPTDPAILIPLFERLGLRPKVSQTIIAESALNDPTGAVLALAVAGVVLSRAARRSPQPLQDFVVDLVISTAIGVVFGVVLSAAVSSRRAGHLARVGSAIAVMAVISAGYFSIDSAGGSGYLGAFLAGLIVGNMEQLGLAMHSDHERDMRSPRRNGRRRHGDVRVHHTRRQPSVERDRRLNLGPALAVDRRLIDPGGAPADGACLPSARPPRMHGRSEEVVFLAWTRETGVVPAALAGIMVGLHVPHAET